mmetsp:Transcript_35161/g.56000  ORF Transcript_35161/g.56000 Transcript_35161/m.56000 type:complete len:263 (+) Transcript_35161:2508-3296(+)
MSSLTRLRSCCSFTPSTKPVSFSSASVRRLRMAVSSSFDTAFALRSLRSTSLIVVFNFMSADFAIVSNALHASGDGSSSASCNGNAASTAFSTSSSPTRSLSTNSDNKSFILKLSSVFLITASCFMIALKTALCLFCSLPSSVPEDTEAPASFLSSIVFADNALCAITKFDFADRSASTAACSAANISGEAGSPTVSESRPTNSFSRTSSNSVALVPDSTSFSIALRMRSLKFDLNSSSFFLPSSSLPFIVSISCNIAPPAS